MRADGLMLFLSGILALALVGLAQSSPSPAPPTPTFKAGTTNVLVDVVVTGHHGDPVEGLSQDSFTVLENGQPQQIVSFTYHPSATPLPPASLPPLPAGVYTNAESVADNDTVDVLLLDALNTPNTGQVQSHRVMMNYLKTLPVNKPVAIFTLYTQLHQLEGFTTDHAALLKAVDEFTRSTQKSPLLKAPQDTAKQMEDEDNALETGLAMQKPSVGMMMMHHLQQLNAEQDSFQLGLRVQYTLSAFNQLARYLSGMPGRKNVMWLSGSFPLGVMPNPDLKDPTQAARDFSEAVNHTAGLLANARVAVYPIDARGIFPQPLSAPAISAGSMVRNDDRVAAAESADSSLHAEERLTLEQIAHATGGEAIYNTNDLKGALAEVDRTGAHYYTLAYVPSDKSQDNKLRRIEVRVHPGNYHLSYRRSYSPALAPAHDNSFLALMQHDTPASTQILFRLSPLRGAVQPETAALAGSNPNVKRPVTRYAIAYDVDVAPLVLSPSADGVLHGQATLVSIAYDRDGKALNSVANTLNLNVPSAEYARFVKGGIQYREQLDVPAQAVWLRAGVYDHVSGQVGSLEVPLGKPK
jgi:VWFA-related protein